jgi:hypothetical protein
MRALAFGEPPIFQEPKTMMIKTQLFSILACCAILPLQA